MDKDKDEDMKRRRRTTDHGKNQGRDSDETSRDEGMSTLVGTDGLN